MRFKERTPPSERIGDDGRAVAKSGEASDLSVDVVEVARISIAPILFFFKF